MARTGFSFTASTAMSLGMFTQREERLCKSWLDPLTLASNDGFSARELGQIRQLIAANRKPLRMSIAISAEPRILDVEVSDDLITARLTDGRTISVPLSWSWRLSEASAEQRAKFEILGKGQGVRWPEIDEDISVAGMLSGVPGRRPAIA
jgi:hypothetical protein